MSISLTSSLGMVGTGLGYELCGETKSHEF